MFGENLIRTRPLPKKITRGPESRLSFIWNFTSKLYRDPYKWGLVKCISFFAVGVMIARGLTELDVLPAEPSSQSSPAAF